METTAIRAIETAALRYEEARDERMAATLEEVKTQARLLSVMKANKKHSYRRVLTDGSTLIITVVVEKEKAKVKHQAAKED